MIYYFHRKESIMAYRYGDDRKQAVLFPNTIDEYVSEDHPVRAYDAFIDSLDLEELGIIFNDKRVGNSAYDPRLMLKLLLYGYSYGIKSSRKLERETHQNLSFIWLMKNLKPDHKTIAEFRRKNMPVLKKTLKLCARLCLNLGLIDGNILFVDSTKLWANAGKRHEHNKKWYQKQLKLIDKRINSLLHECELVDQREADKGSFVKMPQELAKEKRLKEKIQNALAEFDERSELTKEGKERKVNQVDPQSAQMKSPQGTHPSYSVHSVMDDQNGLIVHVDAVNEANDQNQLSKQIEGAENNLDHLCQVACADAGYSNVEEFKQLDSNNRTIIVPSQSQASDKEPGPFAKSRFSFNKEENCYYCPEGRRLIFKRFQDKAHKKLDYRTKNPSVCKNCIRYGICTKSKSGRTVVRHVSEELREKIEKVYDQPDSKEIYKRRKSKAEHPFGYIKKATEFRQLSLRGRLGAQAESAILATCFNIKRMMTLFGGVHQFIEKVATA